jgi:hypothetical protein
MGRSERFMEDNIVLPKQIPVCTVIFFILDTVTVAVLPICQYHTYDRVKIVPVVNSDENPNTETSDESLQQKAKICSILRLLRTIK